MQTPERLGKYPITGVLGQGAMGVVYRGFDPVIQRPVALKTIHKSLVGEGQDAAEMTARFRNEAQAVGRLSHPGIVQIYEYGEDADTAYIAMEYVEGRNLEKLLHARPLLAESEVLSVMDQLLEALDVAHRAGVWHRDIKPANVLVTHGGQVKLTDFGIARIENLALTQVASMIGTPGYMAPEQYIGEGLSHRVDLFAAGVVLYRMLTGSAPFSGPAQTVMYKILHEDPPPPSVASRGACDPFYDTIVACALAKAPERRFDSAGAFRRALAERGMPLTLAQKRDDEDATVVVPVAASRPRSGGDSSVPAAPPAPSPSQATAWTTNGANAAAIAEVERALATVLGPVAKAVVRQAARQCSDVDSLREAIALQITDSRDRELFVSGARNVGSGTKALSPAGPSPTSTSAATALGSRPAISATDDRLSNEAVQAAPALVAEVLGPIAKLLVKKAAAQANSRTDFMQRLLAAAEPADRARMAALLADLPK